MNNLVFHANDFGHHWDGRDGHPWVALLFFLALAAAIGVAVWAIVRAGRAPYAAPSRPPADPALETLRMRFARGEIDTTEYAQRAAQLTGAPPPAP